MASLDNPMHQNSGGIESDMAEDKEIQVEDEDLLHCFNEFGTCQVQAAPASEVFSVKIVTDSLIKSNFCEVYGQILIQDKYGTYELYSRGPDDVETLTQKGNSLSLYMPDECSISSTWVRMSMILKDRFDDSVIVEKDFSFEKMTNLDKYDEVIVQTINGKGGSATVTYATFSTAVHAAVEILLIKNGKSDGIPAAADLHGEIVARYGNTYGKIYPAITLFKNLPSQPETTVEVLTKFFWVILSKLLNQFTKLVSKTVYSFLSMFPGGMFFMRLFSQFAKVLSNSAYMFLTKFPGVPLFLMLFNVFAKVFSKTTYLFLTNFPGVTLFIKLFNHCAKFPGVGLFIKPFNKFIKGLTTQIEVSIRSTQAVSKIPIELCREVVAVPAYSFLRIHVDIKDSCTNQQLVNEHRDFLASYKDIDCQAIHKKGFYIRVNVYWFHRYLLETYDEQLDLIPRNIRHRPFGFQLVEVFAVLIGHNSNSDFRVRGTISITDTFLVGGNWRSNQVFKKDMSDPEIFSANGGGNPKIIPIEAPSECFIWSECFMIDLNLLDDQGKVFIKGYISWRESSLLKPISWYDRRICSVCSGMQGYAAVFYTIFERAVQAFVQVSFFSPGGRHRIHGTIVAKYSNEDYTTEYEKQYYQSVLFNKPRENSLRLESDCSKTESSSIVPLIKNVVAVPNYDSLTVEVDLYASPLEGEGGFPEEHLKNDFKFDIDPYARMSPMIKKGNYSIELLVEWSKIFNIDGPNILPQEEVETSLFVRS